MYKKFSGNTNTLNPARMNYMLEGADLAHKYFEGLDVTLGNPFFRNYVFIVNETGNKIPLFTPLAVKGTSGSLADFGTDRATNGILLRGGVPTSEDDIIAITIDAAENGEAVKAIVSGAVAAKVNITDTDHKFAKPTPESFILESTDSGTIRIITPVEATGERYVDVILGSGGGGGSAPAEKSELSGVIMQPVRCPLDVTSSPDATVWTEWDDPQESEAINPARDIPRDFFRCMGRIKLNGKTYNKVKDENDEVVQATRVDFDEYKYAKWNHDRTDFERVPAFVLDEDGEDTETQIDEYDYDYVACLTLAQSEVLVSGLEFQKLEKQTATYTQPKFDDDGNAVMEGGKQALESVTITYYIILDPPLRYTVPIEGRPVLENCPDEFDPDSEEPVEHDPKKRCRIKLVNSSYPIYSTKKGVCKSQEYGLDGEPVNDPIYGAFWIEDVDKVKFLMLAGIDLLPMNYSVASYSTEANYTRVEYTLDSKGDKIPIYEDDCFVGYESVTICDRNELKVSYDVERRITEERYKLLIVGGANAFECVVIDN